MKQTIFLGQDVIGKFGSVLRRKQPKKIFLVTGGNSFQASGAKDLLTPLLKNYQISIFSDFEINPKIADINRGVALFRKFNPDLVVAVGGGSVIDVAKTINILAANRGKSEDYITGNKKITKSGKDLIAIPTTAGSGSESTHFAVVYIGKTKYSLAHPFILPTIAIVDPHLTFTTPSYLTAVSGMDALSQAIEAYWSVNSTPTSKRFSTKAIKLALKNIKKAVSQPTPSSRLAMAKAANYAGRAINIAKTTACHAVSYPITSYFGVPHGHAVGLTLSSIFRFNLEVPSTDVSDSRGVVYVRNTLKRLASLISPDQIQKIMHEIGLETRLSKLGIKSTKDLDLILDHGFNPQRVKNNPRVLTHEALRKILATII